MAKSRKNYKVPVIIVAVLLIAAAGGYAIYRHDNNKTVKIIGVNSTTGATSPASNPNKSTYPSSGSSSQPSQTPPSSTTGSTLATPQGPFVSNPNVQLSNQNELTEESVCNTTASATCYIEFTNTSSGVVKQLPTETANSSGTIYWNWNVNTAGITTGTWNIEAVTSLGSQTQTAKDSQLFTVTQ